jgi:hypothetical protein
MKWLIILALSASAFGQYSARTDLTAQPYPVTIPAPCASPTSGGCLNGAGYTFTPSDFNTTIIRLTDNATAPTHGMNTSCDASSEVNDFNVNNDRIALCETGNAYFVFGMNTSTHAITKDASFGNGPIQNGAPYWSYTQPYTLYHAQFCGAGVTGCTNGDAAIFSWDFTCAGGIATCNPSAVLLVDIASACTIPGLNKITNPNSGYGIEVSGDDQSFGGSGTTDQSGNGPGNVYAIVWNRTTGCTYWKTDTGHVWTNGVDQGAVDISDRYTMHGGRLGKGGNWWKNDLGVCISNCQANYGYWWQVGTTHINPNTADAGCGHNVAGYSHVGNKCATTQPNGLFITPWTNPAAAQSLPSGYPSPAQINEAHTTWANGNSSDTLPFCTLFKTTTSTLPATYAWDNEIMCVETDNPGAGKVWRLAHTYSSINLYVPGAISQDGTLLMWTSNWNGMVGCTDGTTNLCVNGPDVYLTGAFYGAGSIIRPLSGNAGNYLFQNSADCTATSVGSWNQTIGGTTTDGACTFTNINVSNGTDRTDVFLMVLPLSTQSGVGGKAFFGGNIVLN